MPENLISTKVSSLIFFDSVSIMIIFRQSEPPSEMEYATVFPSSEKLKEPKEVVPSSEKVLGSKKTSSKLPFFR